MGHEHKLILVDALEKGKPTVNARIRVGRVEKNSWKKANRPEKKGGRRGPARRPRCGGKLKAPESLRWEVLKRTSRALGKFPKPKGVAR